MDPKRIRIHRIYLQIQIYSMFTDHNIQIKIQMEQINIRYERLLIWGANVSNIIRPYLYPESDLKINMDFKF